MMSLRPGPVGRSSFAEARKRLAKLERDYQHTYQKYTEVQSDWYRWHFTELTHSGRPIYRAGYCMKNVVELLQNVVDKLNTEAATQRRRRRKTPSNNKQFFLMHGCKSLAQEKMILKVKAENKEQYNDGLSQETIDVDRINEEFSYIQKTLRSSSKPIPDLLRRITEMKKLMEKTIANGALVGNLTTHGSMKISTNMKIKLLTKVIKEFVKDGEEPENILQSKRKIENEFREKTRHLQEKCKYINEKRDEETKYILKLKKDYRLRHKTTTQRKGCRKG